MERQGRRLGNFHQTVFGRDATGLKNTNFQKLHQLVAEQVGHPGSGCFIPGGLIKISKQGTIFINGQIFVALWNIYLEIKICDDVFFRCKCHFLGGGHVASMKYEALI